MTSEQIQTVHEPLEPWVQRIVSFAVSEQCKSCSLKQDVAAVRGDVDRMKLRFTALVFFMAGSGVLGGAAGAAVVKLFIA